MWCYECLYVNNNWAAPLVYSPTQDGRWWSSFFTVSLFICDACGRASDEKNSTPRVCELPAHGLFCFSPSVTHMNVYLCLSGVVFRCRHQMGKLLTGQTQQRWFYGTGGCCFMQLFKNTFSNLPNKLNSRFLNGLCGGVILLKFWCLIKAKNEDLGQIHPPWVCEFENEIRDKMKLY